MKHLIWITYGSNKKGKSGDNDNTKPVVSTGNAQTEAGVDTRDAETEAGVVNVNRDTQANKKREIQTGKAKRNVEQIFQMDTAGQRDLYVAGLE